VAVQPIRIWGDPVLRTPAEPVTTFDKELRNLVRDLHETMTAAPGAGLAAPQIGVSLRVFTYDVGEDANGHLVNPEIVEVSDELDEDEEGCLSVPGLYFPLKRPHRVVARGQNMHGDPVVIDGTETLARCLAHETDHLDGVMFVDLLDRETKKRALKEIREAELDGAPVTVKVSPHAMYGPIS
jgi:peptide deformylase